MALTLQEGARIKNAKRIAETESYHVDTGIEIIIDSGAS